jgi:hypothetical protein
MSGSEKRQDNNRLAGDEEYEERFVQLSDRVERLLRGAICAGIALLVAAQLLLTIPAVRHLAVKVERLEGIPFERSGPDSGP